MGQVCCQGSRGPLAHVRGSRRGDLSGSSEIASGAPLLCTQGEVIKDGVGNVPYGYTLEDLLAVLHKTAPAKVDALALNRRRVEHGLVSVGLKIHCLDDGSQFSALVDKLGGSARILTINVYKHSKASLCLVLPPVGSARSAVLFLECLEHFTGAAIFSNPKIQIQVCSPGRLCPRRSAMLAIGFYLGSDTLRRYALGHLSTTVSKDGNYRRGKRLVIYDAEGEFERKFDWWERSAANTRRIRPQLPFRNGRTDLLAGSGSRFDIENINLLATLMIHADHGGYWGKLGEQFEAEMQALLDRHMLAGLVNAPWVAASDTNPGDERVFFSALQELVAYAFEESERVTKRPGSRYAIPANPARGILLEMQSLLNKYRNEVIRQSRLLDQGDFT